MSENHCRDCCCARSWQALGITGYTGMSIVEHIEQLRAQLDEARAELATVKEDLHYANLDNNSNAELAVKLDQQLQEASAYYAKLHRASCERNHARAERDDTRVELAMYAENTILKAALADADYFRKKCEALDSEAQRLSDHATTIRTQRDALRAAVEKCNGELGCKAYALLAPSAAPADISTLPQRKPQHEWTDAERVAYGRRQDCVSPPFGAAPAASEPTIRETLTCKHGVLIAYHCDECGPAEAGAGPLDWTYDALAFLGRLRDRMDDGDIAAVQDFIGAARASLQQSTARNEAWGEPDDAGPGAGPRPA